MHTTTRTPPSAQEAPASPQPYPDDLAYIEHELRWIEARATRLLAERALKDDPGDGAPWDLEASADPFGLDDALAAAAGERRRGLRAEQARLVQRERALRADLDARLEAHRAQVARGAAEPLALDALCEAHGLDAFERVVVLLALAPGVTRRFGRLFARLLHERGELQTITVELVFTFADLSMGERVRRRRCFAASAPLFRGDALHLSPLGSVTTVRDMLVCDIEMPNRTFGLLLGDPQLNDELMEFSAIEEPKATMDQVVLRAEDKRRILSVVQHHDDYLRYRRAWGFDERIRYGRGALMLFHGEPGTGKTMMAHAVADALGVRVLHVDIPTFLNHHEAEHFLPALFREARLHDALLFFDECEGLFGSRLEGNALMTLLLTELERFEGVAVLATNLPQMLDDALARRILVKVRFPAPDRDARADIWRAHLPPAAPLADDVDIDRLASRYELTGGLIKNAVLLAVADAVHEVDGADGEARPAPVLRMRHLERSAEAQLEDLRAPHAHTRPKVRLDDVVLPERVRRRVEELIAAARSRRTVLERWGVGQRLSSGKGISALLYGPPGTGKTLCAEAIAHELGRPLLRASTPSLVSKWVGETEKNLARLFRDAARERAVLLLDEADSLLASREDPRAARHEVSMINVLLQAIERHDGVVLLATNLRERLDRALARRITYHLALDAPDRAAREAIWRGLLPPSVPQADDVDLGELARRFPLVGGHIRNAVFRAAFRAASAQRCVRQADLVEAAREERDAQGPASGGARVGFTAA